MRRPVAWLGFLSMLVAFSAHAQDAEHEAWIRSSTRAAIKVFAASGAPGLRKEIETCYANSDKQPSFKEFFLEAERCTAMDHLGTIVFLVQKTAHETAAYRINDSFFNPFAHQERLDNFWSNREMNEDEKKELIEKIFAVVYDEAGKSAPNVRSKPTVKPPAK